MNQQYPNLPRIDQPVAMEAWQHIHEMHRLAAQRRLARLARADRVATPVYGTVPARRLWKLLGNRGVPTAQGLPIPETT